MVRTAELRRPEGKPVGARRVEDGRADRLRRGRSVEVGLRAMDYMDAAYLILIMVSTIPNSIWLIKASIHQDMFLPSCAGDAAHTDEARKIPAFQNDKPRGVLKREFIYKYLRCYKNTSKYFALNVDTRLFDRLFCRR